MPEQTEKKNRNTYLFSIIAGIFLPAGFFTGLLGVNIAGIPGTNNPIAIPPFYVGLLVAVEPEVVILKNEVYLMIEFLQSNMWLKQVSLGLLLITVYWVIKRLGKNWIETLAENKRVELKRKQFVIKCFNIVLFLLFIAVFTIVLNLGFGDISLFLSSIFAVLGVALFAQWSILSNLTASVLIFFVFPYRIGDRVRVAEKDEDISGVIIDITMFHVILRHSSGNIITYPNNLILQKGVIKVLFEPEAKSEASDSELIKTKNSKS